MSHFTARRAAWLLPLVGALALVGAVAAYGVNRHVAASPTLVVDNSFTIKTTDPQRAFDPTASIIDRAIFDTLFTYKGSDLAHPIPLLVKSWTASKDAKTFTFQLKKNVHFADGTPLTSADVVFSYKRLVNLKGNPAFLLAGVTTTAKGPYTIVMHSATPNTELPVDPGEPVARGSSTRSSRRRMARATPATRPRPTRPRTGSTRRRRSVPVAARTS